MNETEIARLKKRLTEKRWPIQGFDEEGGLRVFSAVTEAARELEKKFPERFVGLSLVGSRAKGHALETSDVDLVVISNKNPRGTKRAIKKIIGTALKRKKCRHKLDVDFQVHFNEFHVSQKNFLLGEQAGVSYVHAIADLFGLVIGKKINEYRLRAMEYIKKLPNNERKEFWEEVRMKHLELFFDVETLRCYLYPFREHTYTRLELLVGEKTLKERIKRFSLPSFEKMERILRKRIAIERRSNIKAQRRTRMLMPRPKLRRPK